MVSRTAHQQNCQSSFITMGRMWRKFRTIRLFASRSVLRWRILLLQIQAFQYLNDQVCVGTFHQSDSEQTAQDRNGAEIIMTKVAIIKRNTMMIQQFDFATAQSQLILSKFKATVSPSEANIYTEILSQRDEACACARERGRSLRARTWMYS